MRKNEKSASRSLEDNEEPTAEYWCTQGTELLGIKSIFKKGRIDEALNCFERAIQIEPRCAKAWYGKGRVLHKQGKNEEAIECFDVAIQNDPVIAEYWSEKGYALKKLKRYPEAIDCWGRASYLKIQELKKEKHTR